MSKRPPDQLGLQSGDSGPPPAPAAHAGAPPVLVKDLVDQLIWPVLLRTPAAALWPSRVCLGVLAAILLGALGSLSRLWSASASFGDAVVASQASAWGRVVEAGAALSPRGVIRGLVGSVTEAPADLLEKYPVSTPVLGLAMVVVLAAFGGAIARSVGIESATRRRPTGASALGWSLGRVASSSAAVVAPLVVVGLGLVLLRVVGWIGLGLAGVDVAGAVLAPVAGVIGIGVTALALSLAASGAMIVPARMVEDSDAIDAVQRVLAYALARPLRLAMYAIITLAVGVLALAVFDAVLRGGWALALEQSQGWLTEGRRAALSMPTGQTVGGEGGPDGGGPTLAARILAFWGLVPAMIVAGYGISLFFTGATRVYLAMREVCDGQDPSEVQGA